MTTEATTPAHAAPPPKKRIPRGAIVIGVLVAFLVVYVLSLFGVHLLARSAGPLKPPDLGTTDDTVVLMRLEEPTGGTATCREIVEAHGGRLSLANRAEGGLIVSVWLPQA